MKKQIAIALACLALVQIGRCLTPDEIIANVQKKYAGLSSLSTTGKVVTDIDPASIHLDGVPAAQLAEQPRQKIITDFSLRMARPELYSIDWSQQIAPGHTTKSAAWSAGDGFYVLISDKKLMHNTNLDLGLAMATGVSSGVAGTMPSIFFQRPSNQLKMLKDFKQLPEEKIGNESCYVITADMGGMKIIFWITPEFLVKQKQQIMGGKMQLPALTAQSDEALKKGVEAAGQKATPEAIQRLKQTMAQASTIKGSITETYEKIQLNQSFSLKSFAHPIPATVER